MAKNETPLLTKDPDGAPYQAGSPEDWFNVVAQGYKPVGPGPGEQTQVAGSTPSRLDNKPATGGPVTN